MSYELCFADSEHYIIYNSLSDDFVMHVIISVSVAQLTCPGGQICSVPLCTNTVVQYLCNIYVPGQFTRWTVPQCNIQLLQTDYCGSQSSQCGLFEASNVPPIGDLRCTTSILSVNIRPELNGSSIRCDSSNTTVQYFIGSATIFVLGELPQCMYAC